MTVKVCGGVIIKVLEMDIGLKFEKIATLWPSTRRVLFLNLRMDGNKFDTKN